MGDLPQRTKQRRPLGAMLRVGVLTVGSSVVLALAMGASCSHRSDAQAPKAARESTKTPAPNSQAGSAKTMSPVVADVARLGDAFSQVAERVSKSVVSIRIESKQPRMQSPFDFFFGAPGGGSQQNDYNIVRGGGSGVIISPDGAILTNNHVVEKATRIEVQLQDNRRFRGRVVGTDPATDLAVVRIEAKGLPAAPFADSNAARVGEWVVAIGSPFGLDYTVTAGVLSAVGRGGLGANEIEDYLQTDASINPGNSGGPLVNLRGEVLGINTMIIGKGTGIGFAIPSRLAQFVAQQLMTKGAVKRGWIGVGFQELTPELGDRLGVKQPGGALISSVAPNAPGAKAGLQPGDVIVSVDGKPIREGRGLLRAVTERPVGSKLELGIVRNGRNEKFVLSTALRPGELTKVSRTESPSGSEPAPGFGLQLEPLTAALAQRIGVRAKSGVVVSGVDQGSSADRAGLKVGDVIVEADRHPVDNVQQLAAAVRDGSALLRVERREGAFFTILSRDAD